RRRRAWRWRRLSGRRRWWWRPELRRRRLQRWTTKRTAVVAASIGRSSNIQKGRQQTPTLCSSSLFVDHPAVAQVHDAASIRRIGFRVRDLDDRRARLIELLEQLHDFLALAR